MAKLTPAEFAQKWSRNSQAAVNDYGRGIERVTEAPGAKAAAAVDRYAAGVQRAVQNGKYAERVGAVSLQDWKNAAMKKGMARIAQGVQEAEPKMQRFGAEVIPYIENLKSQLDASNPRGDLEANIQRSVAFQRGMANFRFRG